VWFYLVPLYNAPKSEGGVIDNNALSEGGEKVPVRAFMIVAAVILFYFILFNLI